MPYKCEKLHIPRDKDRRVKLTDEERDEIKRFYGKISQRKLAKLYNVSRRLIIFIGCPEKAKLNAERAKVRGSQMYYNREKHTKAIKKHRHYKQGLYLKGELEEGKYNPCL